jgi:hypothetical protein
MGTESPSEALSTVLSSLAGPSTIRVKVRQQFECSSLCTSPPVLLDADLATWTSLFAQTKLNLDQAESWSTFKASASVHSLYGFFSQESAAHSHCPGSKERKAAVDARSVRLETRRNSALRLRRHGAGAKRQTGAAPFIGSFAPLCAENMPPSESLYDDYAARSVPLTSPVRLSLRHVKLVSLNRGTTVGLE